MFDTVTIRIETVSNPLSTKRTRVNRSGTLAVLVLIILLITPYD